MTSGSEIHGTITIPSGRIHVEVRERREGEPERWFVDVELPAVPAVGHYVWLQVEKPGVTTWSLPRRERMRFRVIEVEWNLDQDEPDVDVYVERVEKP